MQTATQQPSTINPVIIASGSSLGKSIRVFHALTNVEQTFDASVGAEYAVAYGYCEENKRLSELFAHCQDDKLAEMLQKLPMVYGQMSVACGDWMACVPADYVVTADDVEHVLHQYSLRVQDTQGKSFETMAAELVDQLDMQSVKYAAGLARTPEARATAVFNKLHALLVKEGIIEF